ncbi:hypothetical protein [Streptomyces wuyuanensis]|uniref:hypothetical protein n=1 Tax=Streptomyces wuyuanensis TaxID=1196353 RepID=UPI0037B2FAC6
MRAVKALLFLGGLVVLGFVLGGQAHATERPGVSEVTSQAGSADPVRQLRDDTEEVADDAVGRTVRPVTDRAVRDVVRPVTDRAVRDVVRPVTDRAVRDVVRPVAEPVVEQVVRPVVRPMARTVEDTVTEVTEPVGDVVGAVVEGSSAGPLPAPGPQWPGEGSQPVPGLELPHGEAQYGPQTGVPAGLRPGAPLAAEPGETRSGDAAESGSDRVSGGHFLPFHDTGAPADTARDGRSPVLGDGLGGGPFPRYPGRSPAAPHGAAVLQTAGDSHSPRPGDQHAVWFRTTPVSALPPGSGHPEAAGGVRDRLREIPEFPG